jgi:hypothetical protein
MSSRALWLRWSWRDLRARWAQVFALALVIALGTGTYAALLSTSAWRTRSNDASFALLNVHDLRAALAPGSTVPEGRLLALVRGLPHAAEVAGARERLIVPAQVAGPKGVLAPGELVGTGPGPGPAVDAVHVSAGRPLTAAGRGTSPGGLPAVVLDLGFARQNGLPATGLLDLAGGRLVRYTGDRLTGGLVLSRKAADDLSVRAGDLVTFRHPRTAAGGLVTVASPVRVAGISPSPMRAFAYLTPATAARLFGLAGMTNLLTVLPSPGHSAADVQRALLNVPHVASAQSVRAATDGLRSSLDQFTSILNVAAAVALLLVFLIAFNTASIGTDERAREHATMIAFGLPARTVLGLITAESVLVGTLGTVIGLGAGYGLLAWLTATTIASVMPEIGVAAAVSAGTMAAALLLGAGTVAAAPLFTLRRLRRIDVPATLRVAE